MPAAGPWQENPSSPFVGWWWAFYLISEILGQATFRASLGAETIDQFQIACGVSIAAGLIDLPLAVLALLLLRRLFAMQATKHAQFPAGTATGASCPGCGEPLPPGQGTCAVCGYDSTPSASPFGESTATA